MNKFGKRLKLIREEKGYTQEELARILGITRSRLSMYEQGKREPTFEMQEAIADFSMSTWIICLEELTQKELFTFRLLNLITKNITENKKHL